MLPWKDNYLYTANERTMFSAHCTVCKSSFIEKQDEKG